MSAQDIFDELSSQLHLNFQNEKEKASAELTSAEQKLFGLLSDIPTHIDILAEQSDQSTSDALVNLLSLEFKGVIRQLPGKLFVRL